MNKDFSEILRGYVLQQREKNPSVNEITISKKMNIPRSTFNRLMNGYSKPNTATILKLCHFIPELRKQLPPDVSKLLKVTLKRKDTEYIPYLLETLLYDKNNFLCWVLAFSKKGVRMDEVKESFGQQGASALKALEKNKIISKGEDGHYRVTEQKRDTILSFRLIKAHLMFLAEQYKPDHLDTNYIHYWVESLNEEGRKRVMKIHQEAHRKILQIMQNEDYKGDVPVFSIGCSDILKETETIREEL